jgi:DNA-binding GntR family transcriptional regulator
MTQKLSWRGTVRTSQEHAYHHLRERILSRTLPSGSRIDLDAVARAVGVSRMPVREAARRLSVEGLLTIYPRRGVVVTSLEPGEVVELFQMRAVLEGLAVRLALERANVTPAASVRLEQLVERMSAVETDSLAWVRRHDEFHEFLCSRSESPRLTAQIRNLRQSVQPYIRVFLSVYEAEMLGSEHRTLLEAVKRGDPDRAEATMRQHVMSAAAAVVEFVNRGGKWPGQRCDALRRRRSVASSV